MTFCNLRVSSEESSPEARDAIATSEEFATKISTKVLFSEKKKKNIVFCLCFACGAFLEFVPWFLQGLVSASLGTER